MFLPQGSWERKGLLRVCSLKVGGPRMTCFHGLHKTGLKVTVPYMGLVASRAANFPLSTGWTYLLVFICWKNLASRFLRVWTSLWLSKSVLKSSRFFCVIQCGWVFSFSSLCFLWPKQGLCYLCFLHTSHGLVSVSFLISCFLFVLYTLLVQKDRNAIGTGKMGSAREHNRTSPPIWLRDYSFWVAGPPSFFIVIAFIWLIFFAIYPWPQAHITGSKAHWTFLTLETCF